MKSKGLEWKRVLKQMYRNVRWMDDDVQDVQETGHKRTSTRFMLLLDCVGARVGKSEDRRNRSTNFQDLFLLVGSLVGIKDIVGTGGRNTFKQVR